MSYVMIWVCRLDACVPVLRIRVFLCVFAHFDVLSLSVLCHIMLLFLFFCLHCYCLPRPVGFHLVFVNLLFLLYKSLCTSPCPCRFIVYVHVPFVCFPFCKFVLLVDYVQLVYVFLYFSFVLIGYNLFVLLD